MQLSKAAKLANKASSSQLSNSVSSNYQLSTLTCTVSVVHSNDLNTTTKEAIFALFDVNMHELYKNSSFGWDPIAKRKELFHSLARFILVHDSNGTLQAFVVFRFETEYGEDIIYLYDIQVAPAVQRLGLGKKLFSELEKLCQAFQMDKIILTVLKTNTRAAALYRSIGFVLDPTSPDYVGDDSDEGDAQEAEVDYEILSKEIEASA